MTVGTTTPLIEYVENGVTLAHAVPFVFFDRSDVICSRIDAAGTETLLTLGTHYSLTGGDGAAGSVTKTNGGISGQVFRIRRRTPRAQTADYQHADAFPAEAHERALDRAMLIQQEADLELGRAVRLAYGEAGYVIPATAQRAGKFLAHDALGRPIATDAAGADSALRSDLAQPGGSALVGWRQSGVGAITRPATVKLQDNLDARDFPGSWNGIDANDDLQKAIDEAIVRGATLRLPPAMKPLSNVTVNGSCRIEGTGNQTLVTAPASSGDFITITGGNIAIRNLNVQGTAKSGGRLININPAAPLTQIKLDGLTAWDFYGFLGDNAAAAGWYDNLGVRFCQSLRTRGAAATMLRRAVGFIFFEYCDMEFIGSASRNFPGFDVALGAGMPSYAGGVFWHECDVLGTAAQDLGGAPNQAGWLVRGMPETHWTKCRADSVDGNGFDLKGLNIFDFGDSSAALVNGHAALLEDCTNGGGTINLRGRNFLSGAAAGKDGLRLVGGCSGLEILLRTCRDFTGHGVNKVAAQAGSVKISGRSEFNTGRGIYSRGNSAFFADPMQFAGNVGGNLDIGGSTDVVRGQLNSGVVGSYGPGPVTI